MTRRNTAETAKLKFLPKHLISYAGKMKMDAAEEPCIFPDALLSKSNLMGSYWTFSDLKQLIGSWLRGYTATDHIYGTNVSGDYFGVSDPGISVASSHRARMPALC